MGASETQGRQFVFRFGEFTLDTKRHALFCNREPVHLTAKPLDTLICLVSNAGRTVDKQELLDAVWKDLFVTEDVLVQAIREIRRALGDDKEHPRFIQTVPRRGYRFVGDVAMDREAPVVIRPGGQEAAPSAAAAESRRRIPSSIWLAAAGIIALCIWIVWPSGRKGVVRDLPRQPVHLKEMTSGEFPSNKASFSPDGRFIVYVSSSEETRGYGDLFIRPLGEGNPLRITDRVNPSGDLPVFTADGSHVVFSLPRASEDGVRTYDLWIVPASGGPLKRFLKDASGAGFSPDGNWVAYTKHRPAGNTLGLSPVHRLEEYREVSASGYTPRFSPDGQWLAYTTSNPNSGAGDIWVVRVPSTGDGLPALKEPKKLTDERRQMYGLTWAADSRSIIFASRRTGPLHLYQVALDDGSINLLQGGVGDYEAPSVSPNGASLIFTQSRLINDVMLATLEADCRAQPVTFDRFHRWLRLSPSGEKLASVDRHLDHRDHLYLTDLRTKESVRLADRFARYPCWLDSERLAFLSPDAAGRETEALAINILTREVTLLTRFSGRADWLAPHPHGIGLAVVRWGSTGKQEILLRDLKQGRDTTIHSGSTYENLRWLPDGSSLVWNRPGISADSPSGGIWRLEIGQNDMRLIAGDGYCPVWSKDGSTVYYSKAGVRSGLWRLDLKNGIEKKICAWEKHHNFDIVGSRLVFGHHRNNSQIYLMSLR